ncbi:hypothetical protein KUTeg_020850 [Tegillarca granosa]|uniref:Uncharacterized protein n=1 Tax=Tegillarca granosa TaxID=220873 RepID=A0ABQ9E951_TEGGR|nr:hypothetical protein KUTeg_020850 [Tegillarca granosa]
MDDSGGEDELDESVPVIAGEGVPEEQNVSPSKDSLTQFAGYQLDLKTAFYPPPKPVEPEKPQHPQPEFTSLVLARVYKPSPSQSLQVAMLFKIASVISEVAARQALLEKVAEECCWGRKAAEQLKFTKLESSTSYHYILETYTEGRGTDYAFEPYRQGMPVDGPQNGRPPLPWEIIAHPNQLFHNQVQHIEVPHTAYVKVPTLNI